MLDTLTELDIAGNTIVVSVGSSSSSGKCREQQQQW
jgi:hypothetical protein